MTRLGDQRVTAALNIRGFPSTTGPSR
jgi:hypothetical protein